MYKKVEPKRDPVWDFKTNKELEGIYESFKENVGLHKSMLYKIRLSDGSAIDVWGSTVLDTRMSEIDVGAQIKIQYLGEAKSPAGSNYHNFEVWVDEVEEVAEEENKTDPEVPF